MGLANDQIQAKLTDWHLDLWMVGQDRHHSSLVRSGSTGYAEQGLGSSISRVRASRLRLEINQKGMRSFSAMKINQADKQSEVMCKLQESYH